MALRSVGWFKWKPEGAADYTKSTNMGIWVGKLPPITKAEEKVEYIDVPGRRDYLTLKEGEDIYVPYLKEMTILVPLFRYDAQGYTIGLTEAQIHSISEWLRGSGEIIFSNEENYKYQARIDKPIKFEKVTHDLLQAKVPIYVQPARMALTSTYIRLTPPTQTDGDTEVGTVGLDATFATQGNVNLYPKMYVMRVVWREVSGEWQWAVSSSELTETDIVVTLQEIDVATTGEVLHYADKASFPETGAAGKIYEALNNGKLYRWDTTETDYISIAVLDQQVMTFQAMQKASCHVFCDARICTDESEEVLWQKKVVGDYFVLRPGRVYRCFCPENLMVRFYPTWRYV